MPTTSIQFLVFYLIFVVISVNLISLIYTPIELGIDEPIYPDLEDADILTTVGTTFGYFAEYMGFYVSLFFRAFDIPILNIVLTLSTVIAAFIFITEVLLPLLVAIGALIPFT